MVMIKMKDKNDIYKDDDDNDEKDKDHDIVPILIIIIKVLATTVKKMIVMILAKTTELVQ